MFNNTSHTNLSGLYPFLSKSSTTLSQPSIVFIATVVPLMILLSLLILVGNVAVIYIYFTHRNLRIPKNFFILSLAIADVLIGTISVNFYTVYLAYNRWPFGQVACDLWLAMDYSSCNASTLTLMAISIERYMSVRHTAFHRNRLTRKRLQRIIVTLWIVSFVIWFPAIFAYPLIYGRRTIEEGKCYVQFIYESPSVTIITAFVNFYGPIFIMVVIYFLISWTLVKRYKHKYQFKEGVSSVQPESSSTSERVTDRGRKSTIATIISISKIDHVRKSYESVLHDGAENTTLVGPNDTPMHDDRKDHGVSKTNKTPRQKDYLSHKRAVTLLLFIIGAFAITWFPYNLMAVIAPFCKECIKEGWWHFGYIFCYINSLLNPICYAFGNRHFNKYFKEIFHNVKGTLLCKTRSSSIKSI